MSITYPLADEHVYETALCAMKLPNRMKLMLNTNVWIVDSSAKVHATPHPSSTIKKSEKKCNDSVTLRNGHSEATLGYGDWPVMLCDMEGGVKGDSKMANVEFVPTSKFNQFSLTRLMILVEMKTASDWRSGEARLFLIEKTLTSTGVIYCAYMKCIYQAHTLDHGRKA
jgi:hypothetical protein